MHIIVHLLLSELYRDLLSQQRVILVVVACQLFLYLITIVNQITVGQWFRKSLYITFLLTILLGIT